jgi:hypothetical protein
MFLRFVDAVRVRYRIYGVEVSLPSQKVGVLE